MSKLINFEMNRFLNGQPLWGLAVATLVGIILGLLPLTWSVGFAAVLLLVAFVLLVLHQPLWGLAITLVVAPLGAWEAQNPLLSVLPLPLGQLAWIGTCVAWMFYWLGQKRRRVPWFGVQRWLVIFIFVTLWGLLSAESMSLGIKEVIKWVEILVVIWLVLDTRPRYGETGVWLLLGMALLPAVVQGGLGLAQFVQADGPESFLILGRFYRAYGTFQQPNPFGGFLALNGLVALGVVLGLIGEWGYGWLTQSQERLPGGEIQLPKSRVMMLGVVLALGVAGITAGGLIASWSRGAWLGYLAGCVMIGLFWPKRRIWGALLLGIGLVGGFGVWQVGLVPDSIVARVNSSTEFELQPLRDIELTDSNYALLERLAFWQAAAKMAEQNLWWGVGFGNYDAVYGDFAPVTWPMSLGHAHNYYLNLLAEVGILGLLAYVVFWSAVIWQNTAFLSKTNGLERAILLGLLGCWAALSVHHLVDKLYVNNMYIHIGVLLSLQQVVVQIAEGRQDGILEDRLR